MDLLRASHADSQRNWTPKEGSTAHVRDPRRDLLLRLEKWLPVVAPTPSRLPSMAHRLPLLQNLARIDGTWERINQAIRERLRVRLKRNSLSPVRALWTPSR
jgi:hypothetical protein